MTGSAAWRVALPGLLVALRREWRLVPAGAPYAAAHGHVEPVRRADGSPAVLKLAPTADGAPVREAAALRAFDGVAAVRLLACDGDRGALLLERLDPGTTLAALAARDDDAATLAAAELMAGLRCAPPPAHPFPPLHAWDAALDGPATAVLPAPLVRRARERHAELLATAVPAVLLHADLHHLNVLRAGEGWRAIDPKGVIGEAAYETGALLRNPIGALLERPRPGRVLARRVALLAEALDLDAERIRAWAFAQAVLAAAWSVEDGEDPGFFVACAELLAV